MEPRVCKGIDGEREPERAENSGEEILGIWGAKWELYLQADHRCYTDFDDGGEMTERGSQFPRFYDVATEGSVPSTWQDLSEWKGMAFLRSNFLSFLFILTQ